MLEDRGYDRAYKKSLHGAPPSPASRVAAWLDPALAVAAFVLASAAFGVPLARPGLTLCVLVFVLGFPGRDRFGDRPLDAAVDVAASWVGTLAVLALCALVTRSLELFDGRVLLGWALATPVLRWLASRLGGDVVRNLARLPENRRRAVIVGAGTLGVQAARAFEARGDTGLDFLGYFDDRADDRVDHEAAGQRLGSLKQLAPFVREHGVHEVYVALPLGSQARIFELLEQLQGTRAAVFLVPDAFASGLVQGRLHDRHGVPVVALCDTPLCGGNRLVKRLCDVVVATLLLLLASPLLALLAVGVRVDSPGPVIVRQRRRGLGGAEVVVSRFRSTRVGDDGAGARRTPFGGFLARTRLDRLPALLDVLQGRLSLVDPPPRPAAQDAPWRQLLDACVVGNRVRPGITGWAQIHGADADAPGANARPAGARRLQQRAAYDLEYLRNWSLRLDLQIIARTIKVAICGRKAC